MNFERNLALLLSHDHWSPNSCVQQIFFMASRTSLGPLKTLTFWIGSLDLDADTGGVGEKVELLDQDDGAAHSADDLVGYDEFNGLWKNSRGDLDMAAIGQILPSKALRSYLMDGPTHRLLKPPSGRRISGRPSQGQA